MARSTSNAASRRQPSSAGRVDNLAIHLLSRAVDRNDNVILKTIYGTFKPEIDRAIKSQLGGIRVHVPEMLQYPAKVADAPQGRTRTKPAPEAKPTPKPAADANAMTMKLGADGVYEVCDAL